MAVLVRLAGPADAEAIATIYRDYVENCWISFEELAPDAAEISRRISNPLYPWLVAVEDGEIAGFASTSPMRARPAYRWSVETGIYVAKHWQRLGTGRRLLECHLALLKRQGFVTAIAGIALPNAASIALHEKVGFRPLGIERGVGFKLGRWIDVSRWQIDLAERKSVPSEPRPAGPGEAG
jgi:L-amino acid N-acyltransferase YncA